MGEPVPVFSDPSDLRVWKKLNDIENGLLSKRSEKYKNRFSLVIEEIYKKEGCANPFVLSRLLNIASVYEIDLTETTIIKLMEKCALEHSAPQLAAVDILISNDHSQSAGSIIDRISIISDRASLEYEKGRLLRSEGDTVLAKEHFLKAHDINDSFIAAYGALNVIEPDGGWIFKRNIALLRSGMPVNAYSGNIPDTAAEMLYSIYWEWENGSRESAWTNLKSTTEYSSKDRDFTLAAARMYRDIGDYSQAVDHYNMVVAAKMTETVCLELADTYILAGKAEKSLSICADIEKYDPLDRRVLECMMRSYTQLGMKTELKKYQDIMLYSEHADLDAYVFTVGLLTSLSMHSEASSLIGMLTARCPDADVTYLLSSENDYESQRYAQALVSATKAVKRKPDDPEYRCQRAKVLLKLGKRDKALHDVRQAITRNPDHYPSLFLEKEILQASGDYRGALGVCNRILNADPRNPDILSDSADILFLMGEEDESFKVYRDALGVRENKALFIKVMTSLVESGRYQKAIDLVREYDDIYGKYEEAWILKGNAEYAMESYFDASESFSKAIEISPYDSAIWHSKGMADEASEDLDLAETAYDKAVLSDMDNPDFWISKASVQEKKGNYSGAIESLNRVISGNPGNIFALVQKAKILVKVGKLTEGIFFLNLVLKINPNNTDINKMKKDIYKHLDDYPSVIEACRIILRSEPDNLEVMEDMSDAYVKMGRHRDSISVLDEALVKYPKSLDVMMRKMHTYREQGDVDDQIGLCESILTEDSGNREVKIALADAHLARGDTAKAKELYAELQADDPHDVVVTMKQAKISSESGDGGDAIKMLKGALKKDPENVDTLTELAELMVSENNIKGAISYLDKAISVEPADTDTYKRKARILIDTGKYAEAQKTLEAALHSSLKSDPEIWEYMGEAQEKDGDNSHALISYDSATKMGIDTAEIFRSRGRVQEALMMTDAAMNSYSLAIARDFKDVFSTERMGSISLSMGRESSAVRSFDTALELDPSYGPAVVGRCKVYAAHDDIEKVEKLLNQYSSYENSEQKYITQIKQIIYDSDAKVSDRSDDDSVTDNGTAENVSVHHYAETLLKNAYDTGFAIDDEVLIRRSGIPAERSAEVMAYISDVHEYGEITTGTSEFRKMEAYSYKIVMGEDIEDIEMRPLISMSAAFTISGARDVSEAKELVAYIYKVVSEDINPVIFSGDVKKAVEEMSAESGDITIFGIMARYRFGVYTAKTVKTLMTKDRGSISVHI